MLAVDLMAGSSLLFIDKKDFHSFWLVESRSMDLVRATLDVGIWPKCVF